MTQAALTARWQGLATSMEALAVLGAELGLSARGQTADPAVAPLMAQVMELLGPDILQQTSPGERNAALGFIHAFFRQALDLIEDPARAPGWVFEDPVILQAMGQASRLVAGVIAALAETRPGLQAALAGPGRMLDIGVGAGWLAIEAAGRWPGLSLVGIDPHAPALSLARANVAAAGLTARIALRQESLAVLADEAAFDVIWLAGPFLPQAVIAAAMPALMRALAPGGTLIFGLFAAPPDPLAEALLRLKVTRNGGHPWALEEAMALMAGAGLTDLAPFAPPGPTRLLVGTRAA